MSAAAERQPVPCIRDIPQSRAVAHRLRRQVVTMAAYSAAIRRATGQACWLPLHDPVVNDAFSRQPGFTAHPDELSRFYMARWA